MTEAKINFSIGAISFSSEGEETWVATQLDKILEKVPELVRIAPHGQNTISGTQQLRHKEANINSSEGIATKTLASFLKEKMLQIIRIKNSLQQLYGWKLKANPDLQLLMYLWL